MNYLQLCNNVLTELNEVNITAMTGNSGVQQIVVDGVNKAIHDIDAHYMEWPFNYAAGSDTTVAGVAEYSLPSGYRQVDIEGFTLEPTDLVTNGTFDSAVTSWTDNSTGTGSSAHTTDGSGRMRLAGGSSGIGVMYQALTTVKNTKYRIQARTFTGTTTLNVGTSIGGTQLLTKSLTVTDTGDGKYHEYTFTATGTTTYIEFTNAVNANHDVDNVEVYDDGMSAVKLNETTLADWRTNYYESDTNPSVASLGVPARVVLTQNSTYLLSPVPDSDQYTVKFPYWASGTDLSATTDTPNLPTRFHDTITSRVRYYVHMLRSDYDAADRVEKEYLAKLAQIRTELINVNNYFTAV